MKPSEALALHRSEIGAIVEKYNASNPRVFGSASKGEDTEESDLDILVDPNPKMSLFDLASIAIDLERLMNIKVDVLTPKSIHENFRDEVIAEAISI